MKYQKGLKSAWDALNFHQVLTITRAVIIIFLKIYSLRKKVSILLPKWKNANLPN